MTNARAAPAAFEEGELTVDALMGGRVMLRQPLRGYRAATDPVLLAAATAARPGERVLDVGCGAGAAALCLAARVPDAKIQGLELQPAYAALARLNGVGTVWEGDLFAPPAGCRDIGFDWVISNPPFFDAAAIPAPDRGRDAARRAAPGGAREWSAACLKRVRSGGRIAIIHLAGALAEILEGLSGAGDFAVLPLAARTGRDAKRVVVTARKGARGPLRLAPPLILHAGAAHLSDKDDFTEAALKTLRDGEALAF